MVRIVLPYSEDGFYRFGDLAWLISQALCPDDENAKNWLRCVYTWRDDGSPDGLFQRRLAPDGCLTENVLDANHWPSETVQPSRVDTEPGSLLFHWLWAEQRRRSEWHQFLSGGELVIHCDDEPKRCLLEATRREHMLQYERELEAAAQSGLLMVCNSSGLPLTFRHGEPLQNGVVHVDSLNEWGATLPGRQRFEIAQTPTQPTYVLPIFERLTPSTEWRGGRISDTDVLTLAEAAKQASVHAGQSVSEQDFLRAAGRGEISLRAIAKRSAKVKSHNGEAFCNAGTPSENIVPAGGIPTLPLTACEQLAAVGRASWRTFDSFELIDGQLMRYTKAVLAEDEPSFETVPEDCRVMGNDVHALADAFLAQPSTLHTDASTSNQPEKAGAECGDSARGRRVKRVALITDNLRRWPTIERDLKDAADNGLSEAARDMNKFGWWWEGSAQDWARSRGKLQDAQPFTSLQNSVFNRHKG